MNILAGLKMFIAEDGFQKLLIEVVQDSIKNYFIPKVEAMMVKAKGAEKTKLWALRDEYASHLGRNDSLIKSYMVGTVNGMQGAASARGLQHADFENIVDSTMATWYQNELWEKFDPEDGIEQFLRFFSRVMKRQAVEKANKIYKGIRRQIPIGEGGEQEDKPGYFENLPAEEKLPDPEFDESQIIQALRVKLGDTFKKDWQKAMFEKLIELLSLGAERVNFNRDISGPISEEYGVSFSTVTSAAQEMKKEIAKFFAKKHGLNVPKFSSVVDRVAMATQFSLIADWVLPKSIYLRRMLLD